MTTTETETTAPAQDPRHSTASRIAVALLLGAVAVLLAVVILTPIALSSQDLIGWAAAPTGLNLPDPWPVLVFVALDAAAGVCVLLTVYCAWRGEPAGVFGALVWCFAIGSAFANWRHSSQPEAAPDAVWFFPLMSIAGPGLLEAVLGRFRRWFQRDTGRRNRRLPTFGWRRWTPGLGATRDTYGSYRTALLLGIDTVDAAITAYHQLCPDGSLRVAAALRQRHAAQALTPHADQLPGQGRAAHVPVDLMRRIPVDPDRYRRWLDVWAELRGGVTDLNDLAARHGYDIRTIEFIRRAGETGLLESPVPPALRLAQLASSDNHTGGPADTVASAR